jgi:hypothetical protein
VQDPSHHQRVDGEDYRSIDAAQCRQHPAPSETHRAATAMQIIVNYIYTPYSATDDTYSAVNDHEEQLQEVGNYFNEIWESSPQVPYDVIILIYDSDTDETREHVKKFAQVHGKEGVIERSRLYSWHKLTRDTARHTAIDTFSRTPPPSGSSS